MTGITQFLKSDSAIVLLLGIIAATILGTAGATWFFAGQFGGFRDELTGMRKDMAVFDYRLGRIEQGITGQWTIDRMEVWGLRAEALNPGWKAPPAH